MKNVLLIMFLTFSGQACSEGVKERGEKHQLSTGEFFLPKAKVFYVCSFGVKNTVGFYTKSSAYIYSYFSMEGLESQKNSVWEELLSGKGESRLANMIIPIPGVMEIIYSTDKFLYLSPKDEKYSRQRVILTKHEGGILIGQEYLGRTSGDLTNCIVASEEDILREVANLIKPY
ncbi:hypothetical protein [Shewanella colwelliana]|uniref:hypothetical protein n=1 Tax=Shewanella colwelliana TaxID=23 RepID=UPI00048B16A2|nr:hypothetical protein [Shewanella colwelliana]